MNQKLRTVCIDFDGTLCRDSHDIYADWLAGRHQPVLPGAVEGLRWFRKQGWEILIHTARPHTHRKHLEAFLRAHEMPWDVILFYTKPHADLYVDDKAVRLTTWAEVIGGLQPSVPAPAAEPNTLFEEALKRERWRHLDVTGVRRVLDIGPGRNPWWPFGVTGEVVEPDPKTREVLRERVHIERNWPDLDSVDSDFSEFDLVLLLGVLEHAEDPEGLLDDVAQARRLFLSVPNGESFHRRVGRRLGLLGAADELGPADRAVGHRRYYTPESFMALLHGFRQRHPEFTRLRTGSSGFKVAANPEMAALIGAAPAICEVAAELQLCGEGRYFGAELWAEVAR